MDFLLKITNEIPMIWVVLVLSSFLLLYESIISLHDHFETIKYIFWPPIFVLIFGFFFFWDTDITYVYAISIGTILSFIVYLHPKVEKYLDHFPIPDPTFQDYYYKPVKMYGFIKLPKSYLPLTITVILFINKLYFICFMLTNSELAVQYTFVENNIVSVCAGLLLGRSLRFVYYYIK